VLIGRLLGALVFVAINPNFSLSHSRSTLWFLAHPLHVVKLASHASGMPDEMRKMCEEDAGAHVYGVAKNVEGYVNIFGDRSVTIEEIADGKVSNSTMQGGCFPCFRELLENGYSYLETFYISAADRAPKRSFGRLFDRDYDVKKTGLYRYQIIDRAKNPDLCLEYDRMVFESRDMAHRSPVARDAYLIHFANDRLEFKDRMEGKCIYAEPIRKFQAKYIYELQNVTALESPSIGKIKRLSVSIKEADGKVLAEGVYYGRIRGNDPMGIADFRCGSVTLPPITEILQPVASGQAPPSETARASAVPSP